MFITFTTNVIDENPSSLCSMTPDCAIQVLNEEISCVYIFLYLR